MGGALRLRQMVSIALLAAAAGCEPAAKTEPGASQGGANNQGEAKEAPAKRPEVRVHSAAELDRMRRFLKTRVERSAVRKSLKTIRGRKVECVAFDAQPALRNPQLGDQTPQWAPRSAPQSDGSPSAPPGAFVEPLLRVEAPVGLDALAAVSAAQVDSCPEGTVPIPEVTLDDLSRFSSLEDFFAKIPGHLRQDEAGNAGVQEAPVPPAHSGPTSLHQYAHAYQYVTNWGAQTNINLWNPYTELNSEFSLGQIWVVGGRQTLEVGLQKYHDLYGDDETHLFIYSTRDGYQSTGCYNNSCGDFVQVSSSIYPGVVFGPYSVRGGSQYDVALQWYKDMDGGAWWLRVGDEWVGYYPRSLYSSDGVLNRADEIDFGGEIIDGRNLNLHTSTDMGSGDFSSAGLQYAAYMRLLRYNYATTAPGTVWSTDATYLTTDWSDSECYDIQYFVGSDPDWSAYFFYGGPGYSSTNCR